MGDRPRLGWPPWIGVVVEDIERQRRFWGEVLSLPESGSGPDYVEFDLGDGRTFELIRRSESPEYDQTRFQVGFEADDIRSARRELIGKGVEPISEIMEGEESSWAYFRDPEGNVFEITQRPAG